MTSPLPARPDEEWPAQAADSIVRLVDGVKQKTTVPAHMAARGLKYGPAMAVFGSFIGIVLLIGSLRFFERLFIRIFGDALGWQAFEQPMWIVYVLAGVMFTVVGKVLLKKAHF